MSLQLKGVVATSRASEENAKTVFSKFGADKRRGTDWPRSERKVMAAMKHFRQQVDAG